MKWPIPKPPGMPQRDYWICAALGDLLGLDDHDRDGGDAGMRRGCDGGVLAVDQLEPVVDHDGDRRLEPAPVPAGDDLRDERPALR